MKRVIVSIIAACALGATGAGLAGTQSVRSVTFNHALQSASDPTESVKSVTISYDTVGQLTASVTFYAPIASYSDLNLEFKVGDNVTHDFGADLPPSCFSASFEDNTFGDGEVDMRPGGVADGSLSIDSVGGTMKVSASHNADQTVYTAIFSNPRLANQNLRCAEVVGLFSQDYDYTWCTDPGCPTSNNLVDEVSQAKWFVGYAPGDAIRPYWKITASTKSGSLDLVVQNTKVTSALAYKICIGLRSGPPRCQRSTLSGTDEVVFTLDKRIVRPLRVTIYVGGKLQITKRVAIR